MENKGGPIPLGKRLLDSNKISEEQLAEALRIQLGSNTMLGQILVYKKFITQAQLEIETSGGMEIEDILTRLGVKKHHIYSALDRQRETGESIPEIMQDLGFLSIENSSKALALSKGMDYFSPEGEDECDFSFIKSKDIFQIVIFDHS